MTPMARALLAAFAASRSAECMRKDRRPGTELEGSYDLVQERARMVLDKEFPKGLDPDQGDPAGGEFYTVWHHKVSVWHRKTVRERCHLKVEDRGEGKVRVGVAVVTQLNNNIDNPHDIDEAIWVKKERDRDREALLEQTIAQRYLEAKPSGYFEEKHRPKGSGTLRKDILDRTRDVDLGEMEPGDIQGELPPATGDKKDEPKDRR